MYMIARRFDRILDDCLLRMDRGESLMDILAVYPAQAEQLKPLLLVAMLSRALPQPVPGYTALRTGKNQMLAEMASMQAENSFIKPKPVQAPRERIVDRWIGALKRLQPAYRLAMLSLVVILAGGFFTLSASASGLANNIMQTLIFSFEQVGDLLLIKPSPPKPMGENTILTSEYDLPGSSSDYSGDFKGLMVEEGEEDKNTLPELGDEVLAQIETRVYSFGAKYDDQADLLDDEQVDGIDEKEAKEDEKAADKEAKEDEKEDKEEDKVEDKEDKEEDKVEDKEDKEEDKVEDKEDKEEDKEDKDKDK